MKTRAPIFLSDVREGRVRRSSRKPQGAAQASESVVGIEKLNRALEFGRRLTSADDPIGVECPLSVEEEAAGIEEAPLVADQWISIDTQSGPNREVYLRDNLRAPSRKRIIKVRHKPQSDIGS